jgi:hypothetical protein
VAGGRGKLEVLGFDARVLLRDLRGQGVVRGEHLEQDGSREATDGELPGALEKRAAINLAVNVIVVEIQDS